MKTAQYQVVLTDRDDRILDSDIFETHQEAFAYAEGEAWRKADGISIKLYKLTRELLPLESRN